MHIIKILAPSAFATSSLTGQAVPDPSAWNDLHRSALLASAAYAGCSERAYDVTITRPIRSSVADTEVLPSRLPCTDKKFLSGARRTITVVMRGSVSVRNLLTDIDTTPVTPVLSGMTFPPNVTIMNGIYKPWSAVHEDILTEVRALIAQHPDYTLESTGHSLGGSLTYLSYIALAQNFPGKKITSTALAAFPIGNEAFAVFGAAQNGTMKRGNSVDDGVPVRVDLFFGRELGLEVLTVCRICTSCRRIITSITGL
ncbi:Alpha/Beta hydrolase protein [Aspergillus floccosus]